MLYNSDKVISLEEIGNSKAMLEMMIVDDVLRGDEKSIKEFCESAEAKVLQERQVLRKPALMRLSKAADKTRRLKLAVYALAAQTKDPDFKKLKMFIKGKKAMTAKLMKKYGNKAQRVADIAQKNYIKLAAKEPNAPADTAK